MAKATSVTAFLLISSLFLSSYFSVSKAAAPPIVSGLSWTFYKSSCPKVESIIRSELKKAFKKDVGLAAALIRLHFHDCFVQGCDGSVLLDGSATGPSEQDAPPNLTVRGFEIINDLRARVHKQCGAVVSCSDIVALAARDSVYLSGGPDYDVPLGRRDGLNFATREDTFQLPGPGSNADVILDRFSAQKLDTTDTVALSGAHTIGIANCGSFTRRLYPTQDPTMDKTFANNLKKVCPTANFNNTQVLDIRTPNKFDNKYYVDLMNRQGLFTSDQDLFFNSKTKGIVTGFAANETLFFEKFALAMVKMSQLKVLTGKAGEIRANCSARNANNKSYLASVVEEEARSEY